MFLAGHTVAMVSYYVRKMITMCSPVVGQFFDSMIVISSDRVVIMSHHNLSAGNCFKPPQFNFQI